MHVLGHLVEGWRFIFYINLPLSLLSMFMITARMPKLASAMAAAGVDYLGAGLIILAFVPLLLAPSWGGHDYPWTSAQIIGLLAVFVLALVALIFVEGRVPEPVVPLELFSNRVFSTANSASFILNMAFMGVVTFLPLYMQVGMGVAATQSGIAILPLMLGLIVASGVTGQLVSRTGQYKPFMLGGAVILTLGILLLTTIGPSTPPSALLAAAHRRDRPWPRPEPAPAWRCRTPWSRTAWAQPPAPASSSARSARPWAWPCSAPCSPTTSATSSPGARRRTWPASIRPSTSASCRPWPWPGPPRPNCAPGLPPSRRP